jgi:hypothetical protein
VYTFDNPRTLSTFDTDLKKLDFRPGSGVRVLDPGNPRLNGDVTRLYRASRVPVPGVVMPGLPDTIAPVVRSVVIPAAGTHGTDRALTFKVNVSEPVQVAGDQSTVTLPVEVGSAMREAQYVSGSGTKSLTFAVTLRKGAAVASPAFRGANGLIGGVILLNAAADLKDNFGNSVTAIGDDFGKTSTAAGSRVVVIETLSE